MRVKARDNLGEFPRAAIEVQAAFINSALGSPELGVSLKDVIDRQTVINWNLLEVDENE